MALSHLRQAFSLRTERSVKLVTTNVRPMVATTISGEGKLITPGFVNAHTHSAEMFLRGRYEKLPLELWLLYAYPFLRGSFPSKRILYLRSMLLAMESLRSGVTTIVDHFFDPPQHDLARLGETVRAYQEIGIRAVVSSAVMDIHPLDALPFARELVPQDLQSQLIWRADHSASLCRLLLRSV